MSWTHKPLRHYKTGVTLDRVLRFAATPLLNGEAVAVYVDTRAGNQLEAIYIRHDGTYVPLGRPFPNSGKEDSASIWLNPTGAVVIAATQIGGAGIDNQLQMARLPISWAADAIKMHQSRITPPIQSGSTDVRDLRNRVEQLKYSVNRIKIGLRQAAA